MPVSFDGAVARFEGTCSVQEAESLIHWFDEEGDGAQKSVDLSGCDHMHLALLQCLMARRPLMTGTPRDANLAAWVESAMTAAERV